MRNEDILDYTEAKEHIEEKRRVTGKVVSIAHSQKGHTYLNFSSDWKTCPFRAVIFGDYINKFDNVEKYEGKNVEITGWIKEYQETAQIKVRNPQQVRIISSDVSVKKDSALQERKALQDESDIKNESDIKRSRSGYKFIFLILAIIFAGAVGYFIPHKSQPDVKSSYLFRVIKVEDGDTIIVEGKDQTMEHVRLIGIEAPEIENPYTEKQPAGEKSAKRLRKMLEYKKVYLIPDPHIPDKDIYDRLLRYVFQPNGIFVNAVLVREGFAFSSDNNQLQFIGRLRDLERQAYDEKLCIWSDKYDYREKKVYTKKWKRLKKDQSF